MADFSRVNARSIAAASAMAIVLGTATARAESSSGAERHALRNTSVGFLALETLGAAVVFAGYSIAAGEPKTTCSWCSPPGFDTSIRDGLVSSHPKTPATVSHVLALGAIPLGSAVALVGSAAAQERTSAGWQDLWITANAFILTTGITDGTKKLVSRQRPAFYYGRQGDTEASTVPVEENLSFFSGDTAWAFSVASSATTLAYLRGYAAAPWILAGGGTLAVAAGVLRISADMHWATDVLAGAVIGTTIGAGLPLLLHSRKPTELAPAVSVVPMIGPQIRGISVSSMF